MQPCVVCVYARARTVRELRFQVVDESFTCSRTHAHTDTHTTSRTLTCGRPPPHPQNCDRWYNLPPSMVCCGMEGALSYTATSYWVGAGASAAALLACVAKLARPHNGLLLRLAALFTVFAAVAVLHGVIDLWVLACRPQ
jgi:hypothetical protein